MNRSFCGGLIVQSDLAWAIYRVSSALSSLLLSVGSTMPNTLEVVIRPENSSSLVVALRLRELKVHMLAR